MGFPATTVICALLFFWPPPQISSSQNICGTVQDQTGAPVAATLELSTANTRLHAKTDAGGQFCFQRLEPGNFELTVQARGFQTNRQEVVVRAGDSVRLTISLSLETFSQQVTVAEGAADAGTLNVAQTQIGSGLLQNLPSESVNAALSSILTLATPGVAADSNGVTRSASTQKHPSASMGSRFQTSRAGFFRIRSPRAQFRKCGRCKALLPRSLATRRASLSRQLHVQG